MKKLVVAVFTLAVGFSLANAQTIKQSTTGTYEGTAPGVCMITTDLAGARGFGRSRQRRRRFSRYV